MDQDRNVNVHGCVIQTEVVPLTNHSGIEERKYNVIGAKIQILFRSMCFNRSRIQLTVHYFKFFK